tara:strand:+ start:2398 stop:3450 length:1053 start_codon:yes stop_codon:yes gene_type:complete
MNLKKFKDELIGIYHSYETLFSYLNNESYLKFLYCHMNEVEIIISHETLKGDFIMSNKLIVNTSFSNNITLIYRRYLNEGEKNIINSNEFYVYVTETTYPKVKEDATEADKFFMLKNRRDFLLPMFFHKLTIKTFSNFKIKDIENYRDQKTRFFKLLVYIRKYIKTKERLGTMLDSSITLNIMDIRKNNDIDLVILHPRNHDPNIKKNLDIIKNLSFIDPYFDKIIDWDGEDKKTLDEQTKEITKGKLNNYFDIIFSPENHFYFFGLKIVSVDYDLKYRAMRRFPKNVADLIMAKNLVNTTIPKIKKLEPSIRVEKNLYDTEEFTRVVSNYLKKFNHPNDNIKQKIEELY